LSAAARIQGAPRIAGFIRESNGLIRRDTMDNTCGSLIGGRLINLGTVRFRGCETRAGVASEHMLRPAARSRSSTFHRAAQPHLRFGRVIALTRQGHWD
jgi:hypothetical protein